MGRVLVVTETGIGNKIRKKTVHQEIKLGPVSLKFLGIIIVAIITVFYLTQSQLQSSKERQLRSLSQEVNDLKDKNENLEVESARLKSIQNIKQKASELDLVPTEGN